MTFADAPDEPTRPTGGTEGLRRSQRLVPRALSAFVGAGEISEVTYTMTGLTQALSLLMPGDWTPEVVRLVRAGCPVDLSRPPPHAGPLLERTDVEQLMSAVDLSVSANVFDPFAGTGAVAAVLGEHGLYVKTNDLDPGVSAGSALDGLQPASYREFEGRLHAVVTDPPWAVLDLVVPLVSSFVRHVACFYVPAHYVRLGFEARAQFLKGLSSQGRLEMMRSRAVGPEAVEYVWLVVFRSPTHRQLMMK